MHATLLMSFLFISMPAVDAFASPASSALAVSKSSTKMPFITETSIMELSSIPFLSTDLYWPIPTTLSSIDSSLLLSTNLAQSLGYFVTIASVLLYTPIAIRLIRTKSAEGLSISTWWCKLTAFTCSDVYNIRNGFPLAAFSETIVITVEALIVLILVTNYQKRWDGVTLSLAGVYCTMSAWAFFSPSNVEWGPTQEAISCAQVVATVLNSAALLPQLYQNFQRKSSGDYSPVTAALGSGGCSIRLFTTVKLAGGDPLMLLNYGVALLLNLSVLSQVVYFGLKEEKQSLGSLFMSDLK